MSSGDWFVVVAALATGAIMLAESIAYIRRGVYTKTFKGTSRREYIHKSDRPHVYWLNVSLHVIAGVAMVYLAFWFLQFNPTVNSGYQAIRAFFTF